ncbi:peptidoglycan DD-metalloendopeptidase family protein [Paenibacillus harenae]|uniref:peptidoglycan DD-metalloendopeptidase family protein n=1 Tax=Paenibacillus harenae TaxID=306543 RepID=UPI0004098F3C|nr:peptidoglycan DD-metalloendopeptidase family protein [Paenibacillus harenae]
MKWMSKTFTFVVIPDANQSVQQFRLPIMILIVVPAIIALLAVSAIVFFSLYSKHSSFNNDLQAQLSASAAKYEQQLTEKEGSIADLQTDLVQLSEQAETMERKMAEINELEAELKQIVGINPDSSPASSSKIVVEEGGQGGQELPLPDGASDSLASEAMKQYSSIGERLEAMKPNLEETKQAVLDYQKMLNVTPTIWPADSRKVTSLFGIRQDPFTGRATYHNGVDIGGRTGDPVYAAAEGVIILSEKDGTLGNNVMINHGRGIRTRYSHLSKRLADVGDKVTKGQLIGEMGSTGRSTGPHLHYEVIVNGGHVNPIPYIKADREEP